MLLPYMTFMPLKVTWRAFPLPAEAPLMCCMPSGPYLSYSARDLGSESTSAVHDTDL